MACSNSIDSNFLQKLSETPCRYIDNIKPGSTIKGGVVSCFVFGDTCRLTIDTGTLLLPYNFQANNINLEPGTLIEIEFSDHGVIIREIGV